MRAKEFIRESREDFEGITIEMKKRGHVLDVSALDDWGNNILGYVIFNIGDNNELDPQELEVDHRYQGQGIARVMYDYVKNKGYKIVRSYDQTDAGKGFWDKHRGEEVRVWEDSDSTNIASNQQVWDYVNGIHPKDQQGGGFLKRLIMRHPQYELKRIPLSSLHIPDQELDDEEQQEPYDPYGRAMFVDPEHASEYSMHHIDTRPVVIDTRGNILDGSHRAWAASELMNKKDIMAYVPVLQLKEGQSVKQEIKELLDSLTPDDVGVEEFPGYRVHFEGFTDECKASSDYQKNPNKVYKQVYQDFIDREGGRKPVKSSMVGDEEYPILYSVFKVPQSKTINTAEKAYSIAYKKKQPWPRGSREEKLIRSDWQLSSLYDQYILKQDMAEGQLNELGNSPSEYKPNRKRKRSLFHATVDNNWVDVFFDRSEFNGTLHITFTVNGDYDTPSQPTSASKNTVKILSTVLNIIKQQLPEYIKKSRPPGISFTAKGDSRASLYRKYFVPTVQNILGPKWQHEEYPSMGMTVFHWKPVKKQGVTEIVNKELWHPERIFNQRVPIGDYEFEAIEAIGGLGDYDADALTIIAYDPKRKKDKGSIGHARFVVKGRGSRRSLVSDDTYVDPKYRGEGIATMMYAYAKSLGNDIKGSNIQTPMGKKMWANWGSDAEHLKGNK